MVKKKRWHCLPGQPVTELDKQVMFWENKGKLVPTRDLIKTPEQIEGIRKSGVVNTGCLDAVAEMIRPGINTQQIDDLCMQYCKDHNAIPACLNYEGYPKSGVHPSMKWYVMVFLRKRMCSKRVTSSMWI